MDIKKTDEKLTEVKTVLNSLFLSGGTISNMEAFENYALAWFHHGKALSDFNRGRKGGR